MDADTSDMVVDFFEKCNKAKPKLYINSFVPKTSTKAYIHLDHDSYFQKLLEYKDKPKWIVSDCKSGVEDLIKKLGITENLVFFTRDDCDRKMLDSVSESCKGKTVVCSPKIIYGTSRHTYYPFKYE